MKSKFLNYSLLMLFLFVFCKENHCLANNMQVSNVSFVNDNPVSKTAEIEFNISWENSWRDSINYDAAWIFLKYKSGSNEWNHLNLSIAGNSLGTGTSATLAPTQDNIGAFLYRSGISNGNFINNGIRLFWNYGINGIVSLTNMEVRLIAMEMVFVPQTVQFDLKSVTITNTMYDGNPSNYDVFNVTGSSGWPVLDTSLSLPFIVNKYEPLSGAYGNQNTIRTIGPIRIDLDNGIDFNNDGIIDNVNYPTGYQSFFCSKYEISEGQYSDFINCLNSQQVGNIGIAGISISNVNGVYYASRPNRSCGKSSEVRVLAYADWSGLRPWTTLELIKAIRGPRSPGFDVSYYRNSWNGNPLIGEQNGTETYFVGSGIYTPISNFHNMFEINTGGFNFGAVRSGIFATATSDQNRSGASFYGIMDIVGNCNDPVINFDTSVNFVANHGDGNLSTSGFSNVTGWNSADIQFYLSGYRPGVASNISFSNGFRFVRSAY